MGHIGPRGEKGQMVGYSITYTAEWRLKYLEIFTTSLVPIREKLVVLVFKDLKEKMGAV